MQGFQPYGNMGFDPSGTTGLQMPDTTGLMMPQKKRGLFDDSNMQLLNDPRLLMGLGMLANNRGDNQWGSVLAGLYGMRNAGLFGG